VLSPEKKTRLQARLGMDRMELQTGHMRDVGRIPHPALNLLHTLWGRFI
jgi:hypothetical protein